MRTQRFRLHCVHSSDCGVYCHDKAEKLRPGGNCELTSRAPGDPRTQHGQENPKWMQSVFQRQMCGAPLVKGQKNGQGTNIGVNNWSVLSHILQQLFGLCSCKKSWPSQEPKD